LLILSIGTIILVSLKKTEFVWITGLASIGIFMFRFLTFMNDVSSYNSFQNQMSNFGQLGNEFPQMQQEIATQLSLNWSSWIVFFIGGLITIIGLVKFAKENE
jgi:H+/Cl- antiporter ClcA